MRVAPGQTAGAVGGVKDARPGAGGGQPDPAGSGRRGLLWARRVGRRGRHAGGSGALAVPVVWGLSGVGPAPVPLWRYRARLPDDWGGALEPRTVGPARGLRQGTAHGRIAALPPSLGAGRSTTSGRGRIWRQEGARGAVSATEARPSAAGRRVPDPAVPCLPQFTSGPTGLVGDPNPQSDGPCGCRPWQGETHPAKLDIATGVARRVPGPTSVLSSLTELFVAHGPPAHPGGQWPRVHQPGRAGLA